MVKIRSEANKIWKVRKKIWNGEWDDLPAVQLIAEVEEFIIKGQKINSIKHYRNNSEQVFGKQYSLKESKDACDKIQEDLIRRGKLQ